MKFSSRWPAALTGLAGGAVTIGVATALALFVQGISSGTPSPILAVAGAFIDATPPWLKDWAIGVFGVHDKTALIVGMILVLAGVCTLIGFLGAPKDLGGRGRTTAALVVLALVAAVGLLIVVLRPGAAAIDALPTLLGAAAGMLTLSRLWNHRGVTNPGSRRALLTWAAGLTAGGVVGTAAITQLGGRQQAEQERDDLVVPEVADPVSVPADAQVQAPEMTPYVTPNDEFYRIDTAIIPPAVEASTWQLRVHGMVRQEVTIDLDDLLAEDLIESLTTLACVSNTVGGGLIGNAVWTGWPIRDLLARAEPLPGADMVLSTSTDGFTAGTPIEALTDDREALLAVGMNGSPLPIEHGYPVRMVVPGLYGYVSATKWVVDLKVTTFADDMGYWTPRGWSERGPIKTSSRIDVPRARAQLPAGTVTVAGVAWAQHRGITAVEVQVDFQGPWHAAELAAEPTIDSWRQWVWQWDATPGDHTLTVRATDAEGEQQIVVPAPPAPDGAAGLHSIEVTIS